MFRVEWFEGTLDDLTSLWVNADAQLRQAITTATHEIDQELAQDPFRKTESREGDERIYFHYPLGVIIEVDAQRRIVWVTEVWRTRRRGD